MDLKPNPVPAAVRGARLILVGMIMVACGLVLVSASLAQQTVPDQPKAAVPKDQGSESVESKPPETKAVEPRPQEAKPQESPPSGSKPQAPEAPPPQPSPPRIPEPPKQAPKAEESTKPESKPQEPAGKKPVGSLILTVKLALMADPRLFPYEIEVDQDERRLALSGKVSSDAEKLAAQEITQRMGGVKAVVNELEIVKDLPQALARKRDELVTQLVKDRFRKSKTLETAEFDVKTENGVVLLSGRTRFQVIILEAAEAARQVPGVRAVNAGGVRLEGGD